MEIIKEKSKDDIDEDKSFLMSLLQSFKKLNDEKKFVVKVEFLNVMRCLTFCKPLSCQQSTSVSVLFQPAWSICKYFIL